MVGVKGQLPEIKAFLKESLGSVKAFLHSVSTTQYTIDGDTARTRTAVYNPMEIDSNGTPSVMVFNLWYHHERSEEHTSELQSLMRISYAVFCLKKKIRMYTYITIRKQ